VKLVGVNTKGQIEMVQYYPSPYTLKWTYIASGVTHKQQLCINVTNAPLQGVEFSDVTVTTRGGTSVSLDNYIGTFFNLYKVLLSTTITIGDLELWKNVPNSYDMTFISANPTQYVGTGTALPLSKYMMYTFRSTNGNVFKLVTQEGVIDADNQRAYAACTTAEKAVIDHIRGTGNAFLARDNGFPLSFIRASYGQNEKIWRKRNRMSY
jgi:hypothetical protein